MVTDIDITAPVSAAGKKRKNSQDRIFRSAVSVLARKGYHNTRITDIARHAGVAYGLVYHYFGSKQDILEVILDEVGIRFFERLERIAAIDEPVYEKLAKVADFMFDSYLASEDMIHVLVNEVVHGPSNDRATEIAAGIVNRIGQMVQTSQLQAEVEPQVVALSFFGGVQMLLTSLVAGYYESADEKRSIVVKRLKGQIRLLLQGGFFGRL